QDTFIPMGIELHVNTPHHPQGRAIVEILNRRINEGTRRVPDWPKHLPELILGYNLTTHDTLGYSPAALAFGRTLDPFPVTQLLQDLERRQENLEAERAQAAQNQDFQHVPSELPWGLFCFVVIGVAFGFI